MFMMVSHPEKCQIMSHNFRNTSGAVLHPKSQDLKLLLLLVFSVGKFKMFAMTCKMSASPLCRQNVNNMLPDCVL